MENELLEQFKNEHKEEIATLVEVPAAETKTSEGIINEQEQKDLTAIQADEEFQKASWDLNFKKVHEKLTSKALVIADNELNNQYEKYKLDQKKELLRATIKAEKGLVKEQAKAEKYEKKRKIAEKRYGYLYDPAEITILDDNGNKVTKTVYKEFTPSKAINRFKEFANWYSNLTENAQRVINTTCKFVLKLGFWAVLAGGIYGLIKWLLNSGILAV